MHKKQKNKKRQKIIIKYIYLFVVATILLQQIFPCLILKTYAADHEREYVYYGSYPQNAIPEEQLTEDIINLNYDKNGDCISGDNKYRKEVLENGKCYYFKYEPVKWRVLKYEEDKVYLLSDKAIEMGGFYSGETWGDSRLREELNGEFADRLFSDEEKIHLNVINNDLVWILTGEEWYSEEYGFSKYCKISQNSERIISVSNYIEYIKLSEHYVEDGKWSILIKQNSNKSGYLSTDGIVYTQDNSESDDNSYYPFCPVISVDKNAVAGSIFTENREETGNAASEDKMLYFGYYPRSEVLGDKLTDKIINAKYDDNGDTVVDGKKYRRVSIEDSKNNAREGFFYFRWNEGGDKNGYHYFMYEPVRWQMLEDNGESLLLITDEVIDTKPFDTSAKEEYSYEESSIRKWIISDGFLESIFTKEQRNILKGGDYIEGISKGEKVSVYTYKNGSEYDTIKSCVVSNEDKVWIPGFKDVTNPDYGFKPYSYEDYERRCNSFFENNNIEGEKDLYDEELTQYHNEKAKSAATDYSHAMGAEVNGPGAQWWLRDIVHDLNANVVSYTGYLNQGMGSSVSSNEIGIKLMAKVEKNDKYLFSSYDEAEKYHEHDNQENYKAKENIGKIKKNIDKLKDKTFKSSERDLGDVRAVIYFGAIILIVILLLIVLYKTNHMQYLALIPKNLKIFAKKKTYYFIMIVVGQIISFVILMMSYGILQNNLATKDEVKIVDTLYTINFEDEKPSLKDFKPKITELTEYMGKDYESYTIFAGYNKEIIVAACHNRDYYEVEYEGMFSYEQLVGKDYVARVSKMLTDRIGDKIEIAGAKYEIVGKYNSDIPQVPINTLSDDCIVGSVQIHLHGIPMSADWENYNKKIKSLFGDNVLSGTSESIDLLEIQKNNFMIAGTVLVTILIIINAVLCYIYVLKNRKKWISVMQICGAGEKQCVIVYLSEIISINILCSFVGMCIFVFGIYGKMAAESNLYKNIYSLKVYFYITAMYLMVAGVMSLYYIVKFIKTSVLNNYKGA